MSVSDVDDINGDYGNAYKTVSMVIVTMVTVSMSRLLWRQYLQDGSHGYSFGGDIDHGTVSIVTESMVTVSMVTVSIVTIFMVTVSMVPMSSYV